LFRQDATPEEDYQAGIIAYRRNELIEAQGIFERAARRGHTGAMTRLAEILDRSGFVAEAAAMYLKAAKLGNADAQYRLGSMYLDLNAFDLTHTGVKTDPVSARKWFLLAAEQGHEDAIKQIVAAYVGGRLGLTEAERTDAEVLKWLKRAIEKLNDSESMDILADAYRTGKYGLEVDTKIADEWVEKAKLARGVKEEEIKKKKKQRI
jgi:TPR repeat protein